MSNNQIAAAVASITQNVNWERKGLDLQAIIEAGNRGELGGPLTDWLASKGWTKVVQALYTRLISGTEVITLNPTDGMETIAKAGSLFTGGIDSDFANYGCDVVVPATGKQNVAVREMIMNGTFAQIFGELGKLDDLCLTQAQIIQFVKSHRKWLRKDGYATFFLFKIGNEFFVARVSFADDGRLEVGVRHLSDDYVWYAGSQHRMVVPQLTLAKS